MPDRMSEDMLEDMPDRMPEDMSDRMPDRMPEDMPHRLAESVCLVHTELGSGMFATVLACLFRSLNCKR